MTTVFVFVFVFVFVKVVFAALEDGISSLLVAKTMQVLEFSSSRAASHGRHISQASGVLAGGGRALS